MQAINRANPSPVIVQNMVQNGGATGTYYNAMVAVVQLAASGGSLVAWINPETGTVLAKARCIFSVAGTGTIDLGLASDGTTGANTIINGGTMVIGGIQPRSWHGTVLTTSTLGVPMGTDMVLVGPGGSGTNNSIVMTHNEAATSTAVCTLVVEYFPIGL